MVFFLLRFYNRKVTLNLLNLIKKSSSKVAKSSKRLNKVYFWTIFSSRLDSFVIACFIKFISLHMYFKTYFTMKRIQLILIALLFLGGKAIANTYNVESPDSRIKLYVNTDDSISFYVNLGNHEIIHKSGIGLILDKGYRVGNHVKIVDVK